MLTSLKLSAVKSLILQIHFKILACPEPSDESVLAILKRHCFLIMLALLKKFLFYLHTAQVKPIDVGTK